MAAPRDVVALTDLLGREPGADFEVVVRTADGGPGCGAQRAVHRRRRTDARGTGWSTATLPSQYLVSRPQAVCAPPKPTSSRPSSSRRIARRAPERDAAIPHDHAGHRPHGGVGGTRTGVKCLHAHYAYFLAGGDDPVGRWVAAFRSRGRRA